MAKLLRILILEDQPIDVELMERELLEGGIKFSRRVASCRESFRRELKHFKPDLVLADFKLPSFSGVEALKIVLKDRPGLPLILISGVIGEEVAIEMIKAGATDYVLKQNLARLVPSVRRAIEQSREREARRRAEAEIERLAAFPRLNPDPVLELDARGGLKFFNLAAWRMSQLVGFDDTAAILPPDVVTIVRQCLSSKGEVLTRESKIGERTLEWSFLPFPDRKVVHAYARDITRRLQLEAQLRHAQKMESVGQLAAGVAHDFNNLLTVIQGHADLLLNDPELAPEAADGLRKISAAAERAANLTRQLLTFSRRQVVQRGVVDLNHLIADVARILQRVLGGNIVLEIQRAPDLPAVHADPELMEQVLMSLVVNARDAMPEGGRLTLATELARLDSAAVRAADGRVGEYVCLRVADTGCGMDAATLSRIFEPFFTTKGVGKGTGLGLATVYGILKQHDGWIETASEVRRGTTFRLFLPICQQAEFELKDAAPAAFGPVGFETVLLVEDEPAVRALAADFLARQGYRVIEAGGAQEALETWARDSGQIGLLLTELMLPGTVSGRQLADKLRADNPALKVLFSSGDSAEALSGELPPGTSFLQKPYLPHELTCAVRECLDG